MNIYLTYFNKMKLTHDSTQYVLRVFGITCWASIYSKKCSWFRLFGKGLMWKPIDNGMTFSERNQKKKYLQIGKLVFEYLS